LRQHAEQLFAQELEELKKQDNDKLPANWNMITTVSGNLFNWKVSSKMVLKCHPNTLATNA
jgi:hypothetical protein